MKRAPLFRWQVSGAFSNMRLPFGLMLARVDVRELLQRDARALVPHRAGITFRSGFGSYLRAGDVLYMFYAPVKGREVAA